MRSFGLLLVVGGLIHEQGVDLLILLRHLAVLSAKGDGVAIEGHEERVPWARESEALFRGPKAAENAWKPAVCSLGAIFQLLEVVALQFWMHMCNRISVHAGVVDGHADGAVHRHRDLIHLDSRTQ